MKKQTITIAFAYPLKSLLAAKELVSDIKEQLKMANISSKVSSSVSLDFSNVSIIIKSKTKCDDVLNVLRPVLEKTNIETEATLTLNYGGGKFIDFPLFMGVKCKTVDKEFIKKTAELLKRNTPSKHGFFLVSYAKNGSDVDIHTENGKPTTRELIELYKLFASNLK